MTPPRLHIDQNGRLQGPANITWNSPWPTPNCSGGFGTAFGGVIHTEVGFEHSVIDEFNNINAQASSFFSIGMDGHIHQYMPLGQGYKAWTQAAGNTNYRGVEHEDHGNDSNPFTPAQLDASAQVFEAMSAYDGWPLQASDNPNGGRGVLFHSDGGQAWGGHDCPGTVRRAQRPLLLSIAKAIRSGTPTVGAVRPWTTKGMLSLHDLAATLGTTSAAVLVLTAQNSPGSQLTASFSAYVDAVFAADVTPYPPSEIWFMHSGVATQRGTAGQWSLNRLTASLGASVAETLQLTSRHNAGQVFTPVQAAYVNKVFAASTLHVPAGSVLWY